MIRFGRAGAEAIPPPFRLGGGILCAMRLSVRLRPLMLAAMIIPLAQAAEPVPTPEPGGDTLDLWPGGAPGAERVTVKEELLERLPAGPLRDRVVQHITRPLLTFFAPQA